MLATNFRSYIRFDKPHRELEAVYYTYCEFFWTCRTLDFAIGPSERLDGGISLYFELGYTVTLLDFDGKLYCKEYKIQLKVIVYASCTWRVVGGCWRLCPAFVFEASGAECADFPFHGQI